MGNTQGKGRGEDAQEPEQSAPGTEHSKKAFSVTPGANKSSPRAIDDGTMATEEDQSQMPGSPVFGSPLNSPSYSNMPGQYEIDMAKLADRRLYHSRSPSSKRKKKDSKYGKNVPTVLRWNGGGRNVFVTGTFNNWQERIRLVKSHEEFSAIINLPPGSHQYKFIVDDEWKFNPDQPTLSDKSGAVNNSITISDEYFEDPLNTQTSRAMPESPSGQYSQEVPKFDNDTKPPPVLPPHLLEVILNSEPVSKIDPTLLPVPNHVMLNHLYALSVRDGVMVLGVTHRYKKKYVTTVLYKPVFTD
eukprot:Nk52_evm21s162 gene=Nk52_evmTU21s162